MLDRACLFVVDPEGLPELPAHLLLVLLDEELGRQLDELGELKAPGTVLVDLLHNLLQIWMAALSPFCAFEPISRTGRGFVVSRTCFAPKRIGTNLSSCS